MQPRPLAYLLVIVMQFVGSAAYAQQPASSATIPLPTGHWTASHSLGSDLGLEGSPAEIVGNNGDASQGLLVTVTQLANRSDKQIAAVRFGWFITSAETPKKILASGRSVVVGLEQFGPGKVARLNFPVVRFAEAMEPYVQNGALSGKYSIEVAIVEARFEDGSVWKQNLEGLGLSPTWPN